MRDVVVSEDAPSLPAGFGRRAFAIGGAVGSALACVLLASVTVAQDGPATLYEATRLRPLFSPNRRPPPPTATAAAAVPILAAMPQPPPDLILSGVIVGQDARMAIVRRSADAAPTRVTPGSQIDGWTVSAIEARAVILKRDDRSVTIGLPEPVR